ncbi:S8 family serine peptidase [Plantactinospora sp. GCM10030261]|uniref:S8 family serine peptidase n=1 Tax=Plantactinospora sp. GCM10030261 TaxID=3273420 RepID=UPI003620CE98
MIRRKGLARVLAVAVLVTSAVLPATQAAAAPPAPTAAPGTGNWVTLITGDRVFVRSDAGRTDLTVEPARRSEPVFFRELTRRGDRYLLPADAAELVRADVLDWELFNVTGLVRQGYDDRRTPKAPLLVRYAEGVASSRSAPAPGASLRRELSGLDMAALDVTKSRAAEFWRGLRAGTRQSGATTRLAGGVERVWLNGTVRANLEQSVPQIGAPAAWAKGLTGTGETVAVLDTGVDTDHPDLVGKVARSKDFSGKGSVEDGHGHGTHVASTIAGSGAASGGRYRGVAPGASLAVGKVLNDDGYASFDVIIEGMRWAAADVRATVVNMSLGGDATDGNDPVSAVVNELTRDYGTLFVASAGNDGADETVTIPAAADMALAVGSVNKHDQLSPFSSRGPRRGDGSVKPEVAAPGEGIVAARPDGVPPSGTPVGDAYQQLDGTSMAAPHVAGAAALIAQQHPDWTAERIKSALMSTAAEVAGAGPFAVGTGRVDVARATGQPVTATGSVSAFLRWPNLGQAQKNTVTWHNSGSAPVTLALTTTLTRDDGQPAPTGLLGLSATSVTVPARGSASVQVTATGRDGAAGTYGGTLVARAADGTIGTRTALSVRQEAEAYDLTVNLINRSGAIPPAADYASVSIINLDRDGVFYWGPPGTVRLPAGRYAIHGTIKTPRAGQDPSISFISHPELKIDRTRAVTLDARDGKPVSANPDNPDARGGGYMVSVHSMVADCGCPQNLLGAVDPRFDETFAATVPGTSSPSFAFGQARRATEPTVELFADGPQRFEVAVGWLFAATMPAESLILPAVYGGGGTPEDLATIDAKGKLVVIEVPGDTGEDELLRRATAVKEAGGRLTLITQVAEGAGPRTTGQRMAEPVPALVGYGETARRFADLVKAGEATVSYASRPETKLRYELAYGVRGKLTSAQVHKPRTRDLAAVRTAYHDNEPESVRNYRAATPFFGTSLDAGWSHPVRVPQERTEYFTPGTWELESSGRHGAADSLRDTRQLVAGREHRIVWNKAVAGPTFRGATGTFDGPRPWAWRKNGAIDVILPMYGDAAGRARVPFPGDGTDTGSIGLYRNGTLVRTEPRPDAARFDVPDDAATYRLVATTGRAVDWWPLSTEVSAAWTFRSSAAQEAAVLPLLTARFDPAVTLRNQAPAGQFAFPAHVERQGTDEVAVASFAVDVSYDDGTTWRPAAVARDGDRWTVRVTNPAKGYASLRARATDTDGNTVEQTVLRAYQIGG